MGDEVAVYLTFYLAGEKVVSYPKQIVFPKEFAGMYPFRGRGVLSRFIYLAHKIKLDGLILKHEITRSSSAGLTDTAFFWPSQKRSTTRYYGYRIETRNISEYIKIGTSVDEIEKLRRESRNVMRIGAIRGLTFHVPKFLRNFKLNDGSEGFAYEPLPSEAKNLPVTDKWYGRVIDAHKQIAGAGLSHGDFAWHNFKCVGGDLWILDWEEMSGDIPRLSDIISLETSFSYYWLHMPKKQVLDEFYRRYFSLDAHSDQMLALDAVRDLCERKMSMGKDLYDFLAVKGLLQ